MTHPARRTASSRRRSTALAVAAVLLLLALSHGAAAVSQEGSELAVEILAPDPGTFVSGPTTIRADVSPVPGVEVSRVTFTVDGEVVGTRREPPWEVEFDAGDGFSRREIRVVAEDAAGNTAEARVTTRDLETAVFRAEVEAVLLYVTVVDDAGGYVAGLEKDDFRVEEDGVRQQISYFAAEPRPMVVGLLIDVSGSMEGVKLRRAQEGALAFLQQIGPRDEAFVLGFSNFPEIIRELTGSTRELRESIEGLEVGGATSLNLAVVEGVDQIALRPERKALIILSDGYDTVQSVSQEQAMEYARADDVRIYTIGIFGSARSALGRSRGFDSINPGETALRAYADNTGGRSFLLDSLAQLTEAYEEIAAELRSQYALAYRPSDPPAQGEWRDIEVEVDGGTARTKPGYYGGQR